VPQQIDYAALADQARKAVPAVDYAALAAQARGAPVQPAAKPPGIMDGLLAAADTVAPVSSMIDVARGAGAGLASTVFHGGDLIRRGLGMSRVIDTPEVQAGITPPQTAAGKTGFYGEQAAEFLAPMGAIGKATKAERMITRMAAEAAGSGGVAALQSGGDPRQMATAAALGAVAPPVGAAVGATVRAAQRAAAGAAEGGIGGAVATALRAVAPVEPKAALVQALKPTATKVNFGGALDRALPELKITESELGRPIASLDDLVEATKIAKQRVRAQYDEIAGPRREIGSTVDLSSVADAMESSIPSKVKLEDPHRAAAILDTADQYRQRFPLADAEQLLRETNAELDAFYNKYPMVQRKLMTANPEIAHTVAQAKALRDAIYETLDYAGQSGSARELNRRYGALLEVESQAMRRLNVAARQQPVSLSEQIGTTQAVGNMARGAWRMVHGDVMGAADIAAGHAMRETSTFLKEQQTTDALIRRAFAKYAGEPSPVMMPTLRPPAGLLNRGALVTPPPGDPSFVRGAPGEYGAAVPPGQLAGTAPAQGQLPPGRDRVFTSGAPPLPVVEGEVLPQRTLPGGPQPAGLLPSGRERVFTGPGEIETPPAGPTPVGQGPFALPGEVGPQTAGERLAAAQRAHNVARDALDARTKTMDPAPLRAEVDRANQELLNARAIVNRYGPNAPAADLPKQDFTNPPSPTAPVKPARVRTTKAKTPAQTPAAAATDVTNELRRVVNTEGAKSAAEVHKRVLVALTNELEGAKVSPTVKAQYNTLRQSEGTVEVNGEDVAYWNAKGDVKWVDPEHPIAQGRELKKIPSYGTPSDRALMAQSSVDDAIRGTAERLTIDIPGDGTFTIQRTPEAIREVIKRVNRAGSAPWQGLVDKAKRPKGTEMRKPPVTW